MFIFLIGHKAHQAAGKLTWLLVIKILTLKCQLTFVAIDILRTLVNILMKLFNMWEFALPVP